MMKKTKTYRDPYADREANRYEKPIASREYILQLLNEQNRPQTLEELEVLVGVAGNEGDCEALRRRLNAMVRDGQLRRNRRGQFGVLDRMNLITGRVQGHRDGFGFVVVDEGEDLFISPHQMRSVLDGDKVLVSADGYNRFGKREARIVEVLEHGTTQIVGRYINDSGVHLIEPINRRLAQEVRITDLNGLTPVTGDHVRGVITQYPTLQGQRLQICLEEIIATPDAPGMEVEVALRSYEIPFVWPEAVLEAAQKLPVEVTEEEIVGRVDMRHMPFVTIDGEDARDFDDAIYVARRKHGGWRLVVAIADVSHYVRPGSSIDQEANLRGTSVYFPNRVVPMLPTALSNGICSLNPNVDRLTLYCDMQISANGRITGFRFGEGVIRSHARLTYEQVGALLEQPESEHAVWMQENIATDIILMLQYYHDMYHKLKARRDERGAMDFDTTETQVIYDDEEKIEAIVPLERNVAHRMIEEAMLAANICAAKLVGMAKLPGLYRNHEPPKVDKLEGLRSYVGPLGLTLAWSEQQGEVRPVVFQKLAEQITNRADKLLIQVMMLRTMTQAYYGAENKGHFGLAYKAYAHFTSPIRRYPDLLLHRAIRYIVRAELHPKHVVNLGILPLLDQEQALPYSMSEMSRLGEHCSMAERRADEASRDVEQWLKCQYMEQHIGAEFSGVISGVTGFGLFVQLDGLFIDGLVHIAHLGDDYYRYDPQRQRLVGERSNQQFRLGDTVRVQVAAVHVEDRNIDLLLVENPAQTATRQATKKNSPAKKSQRQALAEGNIPPLKRTVAAKPSKKHSKKKR